MNLTLHTTFPIELREEWDRLVEKSPNPILFLRFDYLSAWWQTRGGGEWPDASLALITAQEDGSLVGVAPLFHTPQHQGEARLMLVGSVEITDYLDLITAEGMLQPFVDALLPFLCAANLPAWQSLDLYNLFEISPTLPALQDAASRNGWGMNSERVYHCPHILLPGDWETYLAGIDKKQRHEIRRKMRRLENAGVSWRWYTVSDAGTLEEEIAAFVALMEEDEDKLRFLTPPMRAFFHDLMVWAFHAGVLHLAFLEIEGKKAAGYFTFDYNNQLWVYNSGINRSLNEYSPGWVLLGYQLQWANEAGRSAFDFMRGDEEYKYRFGAVDRYLNRATLRPPGK